MPPVVISAAKNKTDSIGTILPAIFAGRHIIQPNPA
jgi:hypothetical protein